MSIPSNNDAYINNSRMDAPMSAETFANLGAPDLAYIRPINTPQGAVWGIFAANGTQLGVAPERDLAFAAALQNDLVPVSLH